MKYRFSILAFAVVVGILCPKLFAQTNDEGLANLQFNFANPGARSLAMGGAFIAMADDATTALANPGGLVNLIKPEVSFEFSSDSYRNQIPWTSGAMRAQASGGYQFAYGPSDFPQTVSAISFASVVYPVVPHKLVVSGFFDEETNFERHFQTSGFSIFNASGAEVAYFYPTNNDLTMTVRNFGASVGFQPAEKVSVGATIAYSKLQIDSLTQRIDRNTKLMTNSESLNGDSAKLSLGLGARFEVSKQAAFGFVYTRRPKFDVTSRYVFPNGIPPIDARLPQTLKAPDSFGFGVSVRPNESLSVNVDVQRVLYSQLMDGYYNAFFPGLNTPTYGRSVFEVPDGTEFRMGAEYIVMVSEHPIALRGGYWREPFHGMVHTMDDSAMRDGVTDLHIEPFHSRSFMENANHISFGGGIAFEHFALDAAYDYSKQHKRFVVSTVVYF